MWFNVLIVTFLLLLAGVFAGLTLALFGLNLTTLERKIKLGDQNAKKVYENRKHGNTLLCTLLLGNVASYTIMSIFLGSVTSGVIASFIATALIFIFGEILPQAIFPRYALQIGAKLNWLIKFLLFIFYPIAKPIGWILDVVLGKEPPVIWNKSELKEIIKYHEDLIDDIINEDEERIILGALSFSDINVADIMVKRDEVFTLEPFMKIDKALLKMIKEKGFSRIPVYHQSHNKIVGILFLKNLIGVQPNKAISIESLCEKENLLIIKNDMKLDNLLNRMVVQKTQIAIILDDSDNYLGITTLEDIIEEILSDSPTKYQNVNSL